MEWLKNNRKKVVLAIVSVVALSGVELSMGIVTEIIGLLLRIFSGG